MHVITQRKLRQFWENPKFPHATKALKGWLQAANKAKWRSFADVKKFFSTADQVGSKTVFDVGGNKFRIVAFIDYEGQRIFIRAVLDHAGYDKGAWKKDSFGDDWKPYRDFKESKQLRQRRRKP